MNSARKAQDGFTSNFNVENRPFLATLFATDFQLKETAFQIVGYLMNI